MKTLREAQSQLERDLRQAVDTFGKAVEHLSEREYCQGAIDELEDITSGLEMRLEELDGEEE